MQPPSYIGIIEATVSLLYLDLSDRLSENEPVWDHAATAILVLTGSLALLS